MFTLPELQFGYSALEPFIDEDTMHIHHDKHHAAYVDNLNKALESHSDLQSRELWELVSGIDSLPEEIKAKVKNNGGGHANHAFFWKLLQPADKLNESGTSVDLITKNFGSLDEFKSKFKEAALSRFGSGWAWLVLEDKDKLVIVSTANQDTPWNDKKDAILGLDVWEHAYYLKYQNKRADYVDAFWNLINWSQVDKNLEKAISYLKES